MTKSRGIRPRRGSVVAFFRDHLYDVTPDCMIWPYSHVGRYGVVYFETKQFYVHHLACLAWNGPPPPGTEAGHGPCHEPLCWNGSHTSWRTPVQQALDKQRDGTDPVGERNPSARLTADMVREIRAAPPTPQRVLAARFGVTQCAISNIVTGKTWGHMK